MSKDSFSESTSQETMAKVKPIRYLRPSTTKAEIDLEAADGTHKPDLLENAWGNFRSKLERSFYFALSVVVFLVVIFLYSKFPSV